MGKWRRILLASLLGVAVIGLLILLAHPNDTEPVYLGKPLGVWIADSHATNNPQSRDAAFVAVRAMGTHAIPSLLRVLRAQDSPFKLMLVALAQKQHIIPIHYSQPSLNYDLATVALFELGPKAKSAVPELLRIYEENPSPKIRYDIPGVLGSIGPDAKAAIPLLLRNAASTSPVVRDCAVEALGGIHAEPDLVVPVLVKALQDPAPTIQRKAIAALGKYGPQAKGAFPALLELYNRSEVERRIQMLLGHTVKLNPSASAGELLVGKALKQIDSEAAANAGVQ
jgi:hypothetical protein